MNSYSKVITALLAACLLFLAFRIRSCTNDERRQAAAAQRLLLDSLTAERAKTGQLVYTKASLEADLALNKGLVKKLQKTIDVDDAKLRDVTGIRQTVHDTVKVKGDPVITYVDSNKTGIASVGQIFSDSFYTAQAFIDLEKPDSSFLELQATDSITVSTRTAKDSTGQPWLLISVQNENPHVMTKNIDAYRYKLPKEKIKRFGIGPEVGIGIPFNTGAGLRLAPYLGVGLHYSLIRF